MRVAVVAMLTLVSAACSRDAGEHTTKQPTTSVGKGTLALGEPIHARLVPLSDLARSPSRYENQRVATTGKVTAVCQEMGCWMEIQDESGLAHVRMHGHSFFVPKTAAGHVARVQATVLRSSDEHCEESPPPQQATARIELDATGIELD
jgi:hypothetical protein